MTLVNAHKFFHDTFGISLNPYLDGMLMMIMKKPIIDMGKFDDWLHEQFGDYEDNGESMADVLRNNYGNSAVNKIKDLLA